MSHKQESDDEKTTTTGGGPPRNIDLVDLQYRPENSSLEIVNHRKTQKLISTDLSNVVTQDAQIKHGTLQTKKSTANSENLGTKSTTNNATSATTR